MNPYQCILYFVTLKGASGWRCGDCGQVESYFFFIPGKWKSYLIYISFSLFVCLYTFYFSDIEVCVHYISVALVF